MKKKYQAIWLTGQPASGKSTLANLLLEHFSSENKTKYFNIDGDDLRSGEERIFLLKTMKNH